MLMNVQWDWITVTKRQHALMWLVETPAIAVSAMLDIQGTVLHAPVSII